LGGGSPDDGVKVELDDFFGGLGDTFSEEVDEEGVCAFDDAGYFFEADVVVDGYGVEGDVEVEVFVGGDEALLRGEGEVGLAVARVPGEVGADVSEVDHLDLLGELAVDHYRAEADGFLHDLELYSVTGSGHLQQPAFLLIDAVADLLGEMVQPLLGVEPHLDVPLLPREDTELLVRHDHHVIFLLEVGLREHQVDFFPAVVYQLHRPRHVCAHPLNSEVQVRVLSLLQLKLQRHALPRHCKLDLMQAVDVQDDAFRVLDAVPRGKLDRHP